MSVMLIHKIPCAVMRMKNCEPVLKLS